MTILLASISPRRRDLMTLWNQPFDVLATDIDESERPGESPADYVLRLAEEKAHAAVHRAQPDNVIVAADTTVVDGRAILGKPRDPAEAVQMLKRLRGRTHQVYTGLAVLRMDTGQLLKDLCVTDVPMRGYTDAEIDRYVATGDPLDKAGAYAIQHTEFHPVARLTGCFASVMGLPLCHLFRLFEKIGLAGEEGLPSRCQTYLNYPCPVSKAILRGEQVG